MIRYASLLLVIALTACSHADTGNRWVRTYNGNQLEVVPGYTGDEAENKRFITVSNTNRNWIGTLSGGEEKVAERKQFLLGVAATEAKQLCAPNDFTSRGEPEYVMRDRDTQVYNGGALGVLIGYAVDSAMSDYANLPTRIVYDYACTSTPAAVTTPPTAIPSSAPATIAPAPAAPLSGIPKAN